MAVTEFESAKSTARQITAYKAKPVLWWGTVGILFLVFEAYVLYFLGAEFPPLCLLIPGRT